MKKSNNFQKREGFALVELMLSAAILIIFLAGLLQMFIICQGLSEVARSTTFAISEIQSYWEDVRKGGFEAVSNLETGYQPDRFFDLVQLNGKYVVYIDLPDPNNPDLQRLRIVACWREANTRIIGEDLNLNGILDPGEDKDLDGFISSPATIVTLISKR